MMKKSIGKNLMVFVTGILMLSMSTLYAQPYKGGIGAVVGTTYGVDGKVFLSPKLALQADFGWKFGWFPFWYSTYRYSHYMSNLELNPNLLYQSNIQEWGWGQLDWFVGGGFSLGYALGLYNYNYYYYNYNYYRYGAGKFGVNAMGGVELALKKVPLAFSVDFRPGFGLLFSKNTTIPYFDYCLNASIRYCFKNK